MTNCRVGLVKSVAQGICRLASSMIGPVLHILDLFCIYAMSNVFMNCLSSVECLNMYKDKLTRIPKYKLNL